ncbi:MAG: lysylphosphatidylglycerol synthase transmembrane domain-containing protein [Chloroflexota bacterium]
MNSKQISLIIRVAVSLVGITLVVLSVDVGAAANSLLSINMVGFIAAVILFQIGVAGRAVRWWVLLRSHTDTLSIMKLVRLYFIGMFFNLFLPTGFGGDVVRAAELGTEVDKATSAATVLLDRMLGIMALFAMALAGMPFAVGQVETRLLLLTGVISVVGLAGGLLVLNGRIFGAILNWLYDRLGKMKLIGKVLGALRKFNDAIALVGKDHRAVWYAFGISLIFNALLVLMHIILSEALSLDVVPIAYLLLVPLVSILLLVPSIAGIGVRESVFVLLLGAYGADKDTSLALAVAAFLPNVVSGLIGWVWYIVYSVQKRAAPAQLTQ